MHNPLLNIVKIHKTHKPIGIYSVCSANPYVLQAAIKQAQNDDSILLIESTSNQVDQYGGYTGMTPEKFANFVKKTAKSLEYSLENIILGGDHLGPNVWQNENAEIAINEASKQIEAYVDAGFTKIHLDTSMRCADDPGDTNSPFDVEIVAKRAAKLCQVAEEKAKEHKTGNDLPLYVIGTDVPIPGGAHESLSELRVTPVKEVKQTIEVTQDSFFERDLQNAWERVIAIVVQPGVEFDDYHTIDYDPEKAQELSNFIESSDQLVYEAHSTDYQTLKALRKMVRDHFVILKVGPALTFAFREAVFSLAIMERELLSNHKSVQVSNIFDVIDRVMIEKPKYWQKHYTGEEFEKSFSRKYSYSDRIRYYWPESKISSALMQLINNLQNNPIPLSLLSQFLPNQYKFVKEGKLRNNPVELILNKIMEITEEYSQATQMYQYRKWYNN